MRLQYAHIRPPLSIYPTMGHRVGARANDFKRGEFAIPSRDPLEVEADNFGS